MKFSDAEKLMDEGKQLARDGWPVGQFVYKTPVAIKGGVIEFRLTSPRESASTWEPSAEDIAADDWIDLGEPTSDETGEVPTNPPATS